ncbi:NfeD family protein [Comamonas sp. NLF-1-9]|uniref:NfeD family protein n=1 Tax=Comamonas sp. NLF-1-9 TaxID=2853163 RepID=UPI001C45125F|nr:NfeD family protein [Comamonas sp. NLF-1-9]QXL84616.1 NfeD family protein [Comamonas sp. NLF-1-9]
MELSAASLWWLATGVVVIVELLSGTLYLLMLALGLAAGAVAAHLGLGGVAQIVAGAVVGSGAVFAAYWLKRHRPGDPPARADRAVNLDVGERVRIDAWAEDGTAVVKYRGANWTAVHRPGVQALPGMYRVVELVGNRLMVEPV